MAYIEKAADPSWMLIAGRHVNLAAVKWVGWTFKSAEEDDGRPAKAAVLRFDDLTVEVNDAGQAHMIWLWYCAHEIPLSRKETVE